VSSDRRISYLRSGCAIASLVSYMTAMRSQGQAHLLRVWLRGQMGVAGSRLRVHLLERENDGVSVSFQRFSPRRFNVNIFATSWGITNDVVSSGMDVMIVPFAVGISA